MIISLKPSRALSIFLFRFLDILPNTKKVNLMCNKFSQHTTHRLDNFLKYSGLESALMDHYVECPGCGGKLPAGHIFCSHCGKKIL